VYVFLFSPLPFKRKKQMSDSIVASYCCAYAKMWVKVKSAYNLTITSAEKTALMSMLNAC
jgi:hypothetical protein